MSHNLFESLSEKNRFDDCIAFYAPYLKSCKLHCKDKDCYLCDRLSEVYLRMCRTTDLSKFGLKGIYELCEGIDRKEKYDCCIRETQDEEYCYLADIIEYEPEKAPLYFMYEHRKVCSVIFVFLVFLLLVYAIKKFILYNKH